MQKKLSKIVVIVGATGSGKTDWGIFLAKKYNGEIINADSRQIYRGMDIGTGKPAFDNKNFCVDGIKHHLFDIAWPSKTVSVATWKAKAERVIQDILKRGKLPIVVGGTGLYVQALVENLNIPDVAPNEKLRKKLEQKTSKQLLAMLKKLDSASAKKLDPQNPRRIIRAIEVSLQTKKPFSKQQTKGEQTYDVLQLGVFIPREKLYARIDTRIDAMMRVGWLEETKRLLKRYDAKSSAMSGLGYPELAEYLKYEAGDLDEVAQKIKYRVHQYARRQMTWWRRDKNIRWIKTKIDALKLVVKFLS